MAQEDGNLRKMIWEFILLSIYLLCVGCKPQDRRNSKSTIYDPIASFSPGGQYIVLTFENGPHTQITSTILDTLKNKTIHATFFVNGKKAYYQRHIIERIIHDGHELGNYGFFNNLWTNNDFHSKYQLEAIKSTSEIIKMLTSKQPIVFRPSPGYFNSTITEYLKKTLNMTTILSSLDYTNLTPELKSEISLNLNKTFKPGDIISFSDTSFETLEILPMVLDYLQSQYYEFLTVEQIMSFPDDKPH